MSVQPTHCARWLFGARQIAALLFLAAACFGQGTASHPGAKPPCSTTLTTNCSVVTDSAGNARVGTTVLSPTTGVSNMPGVVCDGVTDDAAAIQAAFTAAASTTAIIPLRFPGGKRCVVNSTVTFTPPVGVGGNHNSPQVTIDLNGSTLMCAQTTGACLKVASANANARNLVSVDNGGLMYTGASASVSGLFFQDTLHASTHNIKLIDWNTTGAAGMILDFSQEGYHEKLFTNVCTLGVWIRNNSTTNKFVSASFEAGVQAMKIETGAAGTTCDQCTIQAHTGVHAVEILQTAGYGMWGVRFQNSWFEANGDGTANSRAVYIQAATATTISQIAFDNNVWVPDGGAIIGSLGKAVEYAGPGTISGVSYVGNFYYSTFLTSVDTGPVTSLTTLNENGVHTFAAPQIPAVPVAILRPTSTGATSATTETVIKTVTIPAGFMASGSSLKIVAFGTTAGSANTKSVLLRVGTTTLAGTIPCTVVNAAGNNDTWLLEAEVHFISATSEQYFGKSWKASVATVAGFSTLSHNNTTTPILVELTGVVVNAADSVTLRGMRVEVIQ
jgi:hypothetical protein